MIKHQINKVPFSMALFLWFIAMASISFSQVRVTGFVKDSLYREVLVGAHITNLTANSTVVTDNNGHFSLLLNVPTTVRVSYVGYCDKILNITSMKDSLVEVLLAPGNSIQEVVVSHVKRQTFSVNTLSRLEMQQIPSLGAKPDVMKSIQLLPGIQSHNEGSSIVMVRGGNPGENLYLFDNVALIYVNHLGGFTSVFNPDMINHIDIHKGGFPARYGGKLSSIIDITQREGNPKRLSGALSLGLTDASFLVEGPTPLKNSTFLLTGRKTLTEPFMLLASRLVDQGFTTYYGFHDINAKFTWRPNPNNSFAFNLYQGDDYLNFNYKYISLQGSEKASMSNVWGNWLASARWSRVHNPNLFSSQNFSFVRYRLSDVQTFKLKDLNNGVNYSREYLSSVQDWTYKWAWKADVSSGLRFEFGAQASLLQHIPNKVTLSTSENSVDEPSQSSLESGVYFDNIWQPTSKLKLRVGARGVNFATKDFTAFALEPRASMDLSLSSNHSLNVSYMDVNQFSHLLLTSGSIMSNEVWVPSGEGIKPAKSKQISAGWQGVFQNGVYSVEVGVYGKTLANLSTYREGYSNLMGDGRWRTKVETGGRGESYGVEILVKKNSGKWTGFASYTLSKTTRQFGNINKGAEYPFDFDRPHSLALSVSRKISDRLTLNAAWVFQSGLPFTPVVARHFTPRVDADGNTFMYEAFVYGARNSERMESYHRLDLALHYTRHNKRNGFKTQWSFSVYNAYNTKNAYQYFYTHGKPQVGAYVPSPNWSKYDPYSLYKVSFFPIIPTLSYKIFFDDSRLEKSQRRNQRSLFQRLLYH